MTLYILIFFDNFSIIFGFNLHHNFINQFKTTYFLALFRAFFWYKIFLCSFFLAFFWNKVFCWSPSSLVHIHFTPPLWPVITPSVSALKYDNNKSHWSVPCYQYQSWHCRHPPFMEVLVLYLASLWVSVILMAKIIFKKSPYKLTTQLHVPEQSSLSEIALMDAWSDLSKLKLHGKLDTTSD